MRKLLMQAELETLTKIAKAKEVFYTHHTANHNQLVRKVMAVYHMQPPAYLDIDSVDYLRCEGYVSVVERDANNHFTLVSLTCSGRSVLEDLS